MVLWGFFPPHSCCALSNLWQGLSTPPIPLILLAPSTRGCPFSQLGLWEARFWTFIMKYSFQELGSVKLNEG